MKLAEQVERLPTQPGVYLFKDAKGRVIYVGKAVNLRARVRQYLSGQDERLHIPFLVQAARSVDVVVVRTDKEALILENTLIKKHKPRYNIRLVDDTSFLHLQIDLAAPWPRWRLVRHIAPSKKGQRLRHFGPFASASRARSTLEFLNRRFPLRTCGDRELRSRKRPCLLHEMGRCLAPCVDLCDAPTYQQAVADSVLFLEGRDSELLPRLRDQMFAAAEAEAFETATRLRDLIAAIESSIERQHVVDPKLRNRDVWAMHRDGERGVITLLPVRRGMVQEAIARSMRQGWEPDARVLTRLITAWYQPGAELPPELLLPEEPEDSTLLAEILSERRGGPVRLRAPQRGADRRLVELALQNARTHFQRQESDAERRRRTLEELQRITQLARLPRRIECFDNSNIQGTDPVAAMVVFVDGVPERARYRRYRVKTVVGADDFATMAEILDRRLRRALDEDDLPDLIVVDGGKGQLSAALAVMQSLGLTDQRGFSGPGRPLGIIGLAKPHTEHAHGDLDATDKIVLPGARDPVRLRPHSGALRLLQALRDESHDTAVGYHRKVRRRSRLTSTLDDLPGIGPGRRKALLLHFGSLKSVQAASADELAAVPGFGAALARRTWAALHPKAATAPAPDEPGPEPG